MQKNIKIKKLDLFLHILPHSNQNRTENTTKTLKYPISYTEYLYTKWRQLQTFECHNVQQRQRRSQRFREQNYYLSLFKEDSTFSDQR